MLGDRVPFVHPWGETFLRDVATIDVGGTPSTTIAQFWGGDVPWMTSGDIHLRRIVDVPGRISGVGLNSSNAKLVEPPAVAVALAGQGKTRGTVAVTLSAISTNQSVAMIQPNQHLLLAAYLYHALDARYEELRARSSGGGRGGLSKAILEVLPLPLPPLAEQRRIAYILDTADAAIQQTDALIAKLKLMRSGLLHDLLTRGLDENGQLRDPVAHHDQFKETPLGLLPCVWRLLSIRDIATFITSGSRGWAEYYADDGPLFLRIGNLTRDHINLRLDDVVHVHPPKGGEGSRTAVQEGDVLISITADLGSIGVIPAQFGEAYVNQHIALVRIEPTEANPRWVGTYLAGVVGQKQFYRLNDAGAKAGLNLPTVGSLCVALPPIKEQEVIANIVDAHDARIRAEEAYRDKLKLIKQGLMDDLLTGRVRVPVAEGASA